VQTCALPIWRRPLTSSGSTSTGVTSLTGTAWELVASIPPFRASRARVSLTVAGIPRQRFPLLPRLTGDAIPVPPLPRFGTLFPPLGTPPSPQGSRAFPGSVPLLPLPGTPPLPFGASGAVHHAKPRPLKGNGKVGLLKLQQHLLLIVPREG